MNYDTTNEMFRLATELVNQSSRNIFLTGKAGTGKTTFLKFIKKNCHKQMAVVAPTGVAAINAGGVTMHSFFQLPLSPFIPTAGIGFNKGHDEVANRNSLITRLKMTGEKKKIIRELELLIIDEISMVRCDVLDAVDTILRHIRRKQNEPFGGLQVLFIGDMFQLPPVVKDYEWNLISDYYNSPFFFDSIVLKAEQPLYIEFNKIYRQSEEKFINLLNQVRNNELESDGIQLLESRFFTKINRTKQDGSIILTTHNEKARIINACEFENLNSNSYTYKAEITGEFPLSAYPAEEMLLLKVGAQVMLIKNDSEKAKRYFNGKIGVITELDKDSIAVRCNDDSMDIEVKKEKWENIKYVMNNTTRQLEENVLGSFIQYPLRLAWAITIHKSQGLTFEKATIDAGEAFAPGQVYVALSRCTTLDGIILQSRIRSNGLFTDERIVQFAKSKSSEIMLKHELRESRKYYQLKILLSMFDLKILVAEIIELEKFLMEHKSSFNNDTVNWVSEILLRANELQQVGEKFQFQLNNLFLLEENPETNAVLQERIKAGSEYFINEQNKLLQLIQKSPAVTDSRIQAKEFNDGLKEMFVQLSKCKYLLEGFSGKFKIDVFHQRKNNFVVPVFNLNAYAGAAKQKVDSPHPLLHQQLRKQRDIICAKKDLPIYIVAGTNTLDEMARYLPQSLTELRKISGFGDAKINQYGQQFLDVILTYSKEKNISSLINEKTSKRERKTDTGIKKPKIDTKAASFKLFKEGKSIKDIAIERSFTESTIEGHLADYIEIGEIKISELVNSNKIALFEKELKNIKGESITRIKEMFGNKISFGEVKLLIAWLKFRQKSSSHEDH